MSTNEHASSGRRPASQSDVAKLYNEKRVASRNFAEADRAYDVALQAFENAVLRKNRRRLELANATTAYEEAKVEAGE